MPIRISIRIEYTYLSNQQCTDTYFQGGISRSVGAQTKTQVHIYIYVYIYICICGVDVQKSTVQGSVQTYTETDADIKECICREIFLGYLLSRGRTLPRHSAQKSVLFVRIRSTTSLQRGAGKFDATRVHAGSVQIYARSFRVRFLRIQI